MVKGLCMLLQKCSEIRPNRTPEFDFTFYSSTELADIGELLEYRRLSVNRPRSGAGLQTREGFSDTPDSESDFYEITLY